MKKLFLFLLFLLTLNVFGQQPSELPISSREDLKIYAISKAQRVYGTFYTNVPDESSRINANLTKPSADAITKVLNASHKLSVTNPKNPINKFAAVFDKDHDLLFSGSGEFNLVLNDNGKWVLPENYQNLELNLVWEVPLIIEDTTYVLVSVFDTDGRIAYRNDLRIEGNKVFFPQGFAGQNGLLSFWSPKDHQWYHYSLSDGHVMTSEIYDLSMESSIHGIRVQDVGIPILHQIQTVNGWGIKTTIEYHSLTNGIIPARFSTSEGKKAYGAWIRTSDSDWEFYPMDDSKFPRINLPVEAGKVYYVSPEFLPQDFQDSDNAKG